MTSKIVNSLTIVVAILVFLIGAGAFTLSYDALYATGQANGIPASKAWIWPLIIDIPLIVFTLALLVFQIMRESIRLWAGLVILFTLATVVFNLSHAQATWLGWTVAIVAPVGLLLTTEALRHLAKVIIERQAVAKSLKELTGELDSKRQELDTLAGQVDNLTVKRGELSAQVEALRSEQQVLNFEQISPKVDTLNAARQDRRQERLDTLLGFLGDNPQANLTEAGQHIGVSRQTTSSYVNELTQAGKLHKNGKGWEVSNG